ncbi:MAG: hypothetical protein UHS51_08540 [Atopobiaceae bacterium]|nr:hypothetical protein [Atopobiaceae bacterium]
MISRVIAHRMPTVMGADKIVVLDRGHVVERGAPEDLLQQGGAFAHMVSLQSKAAEWSLVEW